MFKYFYSLIIISEILALDFAELKYEICVYLMLEMAFLDLPSHFQPQNWFFRLPQQNEFSFSIFICIFTAIELVDIDHVYLNFFSIFLDNAVLNFHLIGYLFIYFRLENRQEKLPYIHYVLYFELN